MTEVKWQKRNKLTDSPTNPLQELREILTRTSRDTSEDKMIACMYGIIVGWDDASYKELRVKHGWTDSNIQRQKTWHENYKRAWNLFMNTHGEQNKEEMKIQFIWNGNIVGHTHHLLVDGGNVILDIRDSETFDDEPIWSRDEAEDIFIKALKDMYDVDYTKDDITWEWGGEL